MLDASLRTNLLASELKNHSHGARIDKQVMYILIKHEIRFCVRHSTTLGSLVISKELHEEIACIAYLLRCKSVSPKATSYEFIGCILLLTLNPTRGQDYNRHKYQRLETGVSIEVPYGMIVNITFDKFQMTYSGDSCYLAHVLIHKILTSKSPIVGDLCIYNGFPGDIRSLLSSEHKVSIDVKGLFAYIDYNG